MRQAPARLSRYAPALMHIFSLYIEYGKDWIEDVLQGLSELQGIYPIFFKSVLCVLYDCENLKTLGTKPIIYPDGLFLLSLDVSGRK